MFLKADNLSKTYSSGFLSGKKVAALQNASITIREGETVGIFGKSGSGKTTLANLIAGGDSRVIRPDFLGRQAGCIPLSRPTPAGYSDGISASGGGIDPCWSLERSLMEPYRIHRLDFSEEKFTALLEQVGLYKEHLSRDLSSLSGGELQRAALARVMSMSPQLILLDEPTSMLDSISQAQILQILKTYQKQHRTAYLLITHDCKSCAICVTGATFWKMAVSRGRRNTPMWKKNLRRFTRKLLISLLTIFLVATFNFFLIRFMPGDPLEHLVGEEDYLYLTSAHPEVLEELEVEYGLDGTLWSNTRPIWGGCSMGTWDTPIKIKWRY